MKKTIFYIALVMCLQARAQDIYLSHFDAAPQYLNPALTGMYFGEKLDYRININYAAQALGGFSNMYNTAAIGYDFQINKFGVGGYLIRSQAGETNFNTMNGMFSIAYEVTIDRTYRHNLLTGIQGGLFQNGFNQEKLLFENQYNPATSGFDQTIGSGEQFEKTNVWTFDASWGAFYQYRDLRKTFNPFGGLAIFHATQQNVSYYGLESKYPIRYSIYGGFGLNLNETFQISPRVLFMRQANRQMMDIGLFHFFNPSYSNYGYIFGLLYNSNDNMTVHTGMKINNNIYRVSYGFNTSIQGTFNSARNYFEFSAIMTRKTNAQPSYR